MRGARMESGTGIVGLAGSTSAKLVTMTSRSLVSADLIDRLDQLVLRDDYFRIGVVQFIGKFERAR